ncbi:MAG TPA: hypothetical protein VFN26_11785 [Candidatus Acidoferrum sp.]|nr:hypothetical protein [Candidatus Acidoferrum sp.]
MRDVSIVGAVLAGLVSFLSPLVLPLVRGYYEMDKTIQSRLETRVR